MIATQTLVFLDDNSILLLNYYKVIILIGIEFVEAIARILSPSCSIILLLFVNV